MTSDPAAPDAAAVYLERDEDVNIPEHFHRIYARIKILNERGKQQFSEYEIPYEAGQSAIRAVEGRTVHSDGTVVPFAGSTYDKELVKSGDVRVMAKVFAMPDVQVGSIVEYRYQIQYDDQWVFPAQFYLQQPLYVHHAHYQFIPAPINLESSRQVQIMDAQGHPHFANRMLYDATLPPGAKLRELPNGYDLVVDNMAPIADEPWSPPLSSFSYRLLFYYSADWTGQDFWNSSGHMWSKDVDRFAASSDRIAKAVGGIVAPGDTDTQKLEKIYATVMTVENTAFSRKHSEAENREQGRAGEDSGRYLGSKARLAQRD